MSACIVRKFENENVWAVSKNDSMFAPTFTDHLSAMLFAYAFSQTDWLKPDLWTEVAQEKLQSSIRDFVEEKFPEGKKNEREIPAEWLRVILTAKYDEDLADYFSGEITDAKLARYYSYEDLVEDCAASWKQGKLNVLEMVYDWFRAWQKK